MRFKVSKNKFISIVLISFFVFGLFSFNTFETSKAYTETTFDSGIKTISEPLRLTVNMQETTVTDYTEAEKSNYTTIILFVISAILCIVGLALTFPLLPLISLTISVLNIIFLSETTIFNILLLLLNVTFTVIALVRAKTKNN